MTDRLLDAKEIAERLGVPETWVRESTRSGAMPAIRLGRYWRYDMADVDAWIETCKQPGRSIRPRIRTDIFEDGVEAASGATSRGEAKP